ncbi:hypothetical protein [Paraburkholderia sediminicola]|uniref:hypothetical protein n=1 Tax=Paraburkholderia sediminicola TaxID=458836 RepID=UPI0038B6DA75
MIKIQRHVFALYFGSMVFCMLQAGVTATAQTQGPVPTEEKITDLEASAKATAVWQRQIKTVLPTTRGCHRATYPSLVWRDTPCAQTAGLPPASPRPPENALLVGGAGGDVLATAFSPFNIVSFEGSFLNVNTTGWFNVNTTSGLVSGRNEYSLQISTNKFNTPLCADAHPLAADGNCQGWEQVLYSTGEGIVWLQSWLLNFGNPGDSCPGGWLAVSEFKRVDCAFNGAGIAIPPQTSPASLRQLVLKLSVDPTTDRLWLFNTGAEVVEADNDDKLGLAANWLNAEFGIYGDLTLHLARFDANSSLVLQLNYERSDALIATPTFQLAQGTTGETNSLTLVRSPICVRSAPFNSVTFKESNIANDGYACPALPGPVSACQVATEDVTTAEQTLAKAMAAEQKPTCKGTNSVNCIREAAAAQQAVSAAVALKAKDCKPT